MTVISGGVSYDSATGDSLTLKTAPANTVPIGIPISELDGSVRFAPASIPGVATSIVGLPVTGNSSTLGISIEQHP